jgi:hypothetical protein
MGKRFTEGIAFDGTAILDNGKPITITEILNNLNRLDKVESKLKKLRVTDVSRQSELLFAFIAEIKSEFADQNWDYLDFIAERVIGKQ